MRKIIRLTERDLTKLVKRVLNESKLNEPTIGENNTYASFDEAYSFMMELDEYLNELAPSDKVCSERHLKMLNRIYNTAHYMVLELRDKYKGGPDLPAQRNYSSNSNDEKINDFIKKYDHLPDTKFYEFAELLSKEIGVSVEEIENKRSEFIKKEFSKLLKPEWDEGRMRKDSQHKQAQEMFSMARTWLDCCKKGYYDCDDDDPPFKFNKGPFKYKEPNVTYEPIKTGGGQPTKDDKLDSKNPGREMSEQIRRTLRKLL